MATRGGYPMNAGSPMNLGGNPMNPNINPMNSGQGGLRIPHAMQQNPGYRTMGTGASPYHQRQGMPPGRGMPMPGMGPVPGPSYGSGMPMRPGMLQQGMDPYRKRFLLQQQQQQHHGMHNQRRGEVWAREKSALY
ncbi:UNVERIFIED_CONTAM: hypothetical protein FKN15_016329 [Acipenser sinensis]